MKTAISIPDALFKRAERLAKRWGITRSELFARGVAMLIQGEEQGNVTARINAALAASDEGSSLDPAMKKAADDVLARSEWDEAR